jgi:N-acetylglucosamine-6-sulfatase
VDLPASCPTFPQVLQRSGYRTAFIGKWHQARTARPRPGFDRWVSLKGQGDYERNTLNVDGQWVLSRDYVTDVLNDHALRFLDEQDARPFCLVLAHKAVHLPLVPAPRHRGLYAQQRVDPAFDVPAYGRVLAGLDESVGAVLDKLRTKRVLDDTLVVYASDNGLLMGEHGGTADKRLPYEAAIRIPLLMSLPGTFAPGATVDDLVLNIDLAPTVIARCGAESLPCDGRDATAFRRESFLYEYFPTDAAVPPVAAVRTRSWKYIFYPRNPELPDEMYDLAADPREARNLAPDPAHAPQREQLRRELARLWQETGGNRPSG